MDVLMLLLRGLAFVLVHAVRALGVGMIVLVRGVRWSYRALFTPRSVAHGSARWASWSELRRGRVFGRSGVVLGKSHGRLVTFADEGHTLVVAAARGGKTAGICVPSILEARGSVVAVDPKAELFDLTHEDRARRGPVYRLDLIDPITSDLFNPLDLIRLNTIHEADDALALAALMVDESVEAAAHWDYKAKEVLSALMIYVCKRYAHEPDLRTLARMKSLTALGLAGLVDELADADTLGSDTLTNVARALKGAQNSAEALSIVSNTDKALLLYSADRPGGIVTRASDFSMGAFRRSVATLYLIVPADKLAVQGPFLRLMMGAALMMQTREQDIVPPAKTLFVVDEAGVIGGIPELATGVAVSAAVAHILLVFQDFGQVERNYGKLARSLLANAGAFVCFSVRDIETATMVSRALGDHTVLSRSDGISEASTALLFHRDSINHSESGRPLLDPSEILRLPADQAIVLMNGVRYPILLRKVRFFAMRRYRQRVGVWRGYRRARGTVAGWWKTAP